MSNSDFKNHFWWCFAEFHPEMWMKYSVLRISLIIWVIFLKMNRTRIDNLDSDFLSKFKYYWKYNDH
jgi:hypothetical protein